MICAYTHSDKMLLAAPYTPTYIGPIYTCKTASNSSERSIVTTSNTSVNGFAAHMQ